MVEQDIHPPRGSADRGHIMEAGNVMTKKAASGLIDNDDGRRTLSSSPPSITIDELFDALCASPAEPPFFTAVDTSRTASPRINASMDQPANAGAVKSDALSHAGSED